MAGSIHFLAIDPQSPDTLYAGTSRGIYKSVSRGDSWHAANDGLLYPDTTIEAIVVDPANSNTVFAGAYEGVYKSTNGGNTWALANHGLPGSPYTAHLVITPDPQPILYATAHRYGVYYSTDDGDSWHPRRDGLPTISEGDYETIYALACDPNRSSTLYAVTSEGPYKTTNGGEHWSAIIEGLPIAGSDSIGVGHDPNSTLYVGTTNGVYKSTDGGTSWIHSSNGIPASENSLIVAIHTDSRDPDLVFASLRYREEGTLKGDLYRSLDAGDSWHLITDGLFLPGIRAITSTALRPNTLYISTGGHGIFRSNNGGDSWASSSEGINLTWVFSVAVDPTRPEVVYSGTGGHGFFKSIDGGDSWTTKRNQLSLSTVYEIVIDPSTPSTLYAGTNHGVFKSTDGAATWIGDENLARSATGNTRTIALDPFNPETLYATGNGTIYKSTDGAGSWIEVSDGVPDCYWGVGFTIHPIDTNIVYAGGEKLCDNVESILLKTLDGGEHWSNLEGPFAGYDYFLGLAMDPFAPDTILAAAYNSAQFHGDYLKSADGGSTWEALDTGLPDGEAIAHMVMSPNVPDTAYATTTWSNVLVSYNGGHGWEIIDEDSLEYTVLYDISLTTSSPPDLFVGTSRGVYALRQVPIPGDCDGDDTVSIGEVQGSINMFLGVAALQCDVDHDDDGIVSIAEVQQVINGFLGVGMSC